METDNIKERFNLIAEEYDSQRKKFIPCFEDFYITMIDFIAKLIPLPNSILDLGAGTGLLSKYLFDHFANAEYTLVDISEQMLEVAKKRFENMKNIKCQILDYSKDFPIENYDLIASALSIHHLENDDKNNLFKKIYFELPEEGCFVNLDQFNPNSQILNDHYNLWWYEYIKKSDLQKDEHDKLLKRRELDRENTILKQ